MSNKILSAENVDNLLWLCGASDRSESESAARIRASYAAQAERIEELKAAVIRRSGSSSWQEWAGIWDPTEETAVEATKRLFQRIKELEQKIGRMTQAVDVMANLTDRTQDERDAAIQRADGVGQSLVNAYAAQAKRIEELEAANRELRSINVEPGITLGLARAYRNGAAILHDAMKLIANLDASFEKASSGQATEIARSALEEYHYRLDDTKPATIEQQRDSTLQRAEKAEILLRQIREVLPAERAREIADRSADLLIDSNQRLMEKAALRSYAEKMEVKS